MRKGASSCVLAVNVGNTNTTVALLTDEQVLTFRTVRTNTVSGQTARGLCSRVARQRRLDGTILCSVVPAVNRTWLAALGRMSGKRPLVIGPGLRLGVRIAYSKPQTLGADRIANAVGAAGRAGRGRNVVVVSVGTATTVDLVTREGVFAGGAIIPGPTAMALCLKQSTALLPEVDMSRAQVAGRPGRTTAEAIRLGIGVGYPAMVDALIRRLAGGRERQTEVLVTGGASRVLPEKNRNVVPHLALEGMARIFELNRRMRSSG